MLKMDAHPTHAPAMRDLMIRAETLRRACILETCAVNMRVAGFDAVFGPRGYDGGLWVTEDSSIDQWNLWGCYKESEYRVECRGWDWSYGHWHGRWHGQLDLDDSVMELLDRRALRRRNPGADVLVEWDFVVEPAEPECDDLHAYRDKCWNDVEAIFDEIARDGRLSEEGRLNLLQRCVARVTLIDRAEADFGLKQIFAEHRREGRLSARDAYHLEAFAEHWADLESYDVEYVYPREIWVTTRLERLELWNVWNCLELVGEEWVWRREQWRPAGRALLQRPLAGDSRFFLNGLGTSAPRAGPAQRK